MNEKLILPDKMTYGEAYGPAMKITDPDEAARWFEALVERQMRVFAVSREGATADIRGNLGYYSGYYSDETRRRVEKLFLAVHPIFGAIDRPDPIDPFGAGKALGEVAKHNED